MTRIVSSKPKKQRKAFHSRKMHELVKELAVHLSKELKKSTGRRAINARKDDKVKVMRGKFAGKEGKIVSVNHKKRRVFIEGIMRKKVSGKEIFVPLQASNLVLVELYSKDKKRMKRPAGKAGHAKDEKAEKPVAKESKGKEPTGKKETVSKVKK